MRTLRVRIPRVVPAGVSAVCARALRRVSMRHGGGNRNKPMAEDDASSPSPGDVAQPIPASPPSTGGSPTTAPSGAEAGGGYQCLPHAAHRLLMDAVSVSSGYVQRLADMAPTPPSLWGAPSVVERTPPPHHAAQGALHNPPAVEAYGAEATAPQHQVVVEGSSSVSKTPTVAVARLMDGARDYWNLLFHGTTSLGAASTRHATLLYQTLTQWCKWMPLLRGAEGYRRVLWYYSVLLLLIKVVATLVALKLMVVAANVLLDVCDVCHRAKGIIALRGVGPQQQDHLAASLVRGGGEQQQQQQGANTTLTYSFVR